MLETRTRQLWEAKGLVTGDVPPTTVMLAASSYSLVMTLTKAEASSKRMRGFLNWEKRQNKLQNKVKHGLSWSQKGFRGAVLLYGPCCPDRAGAMPVARLHGTASIRDCRTRLRLSPSHKNFLSFPPAAQARLVYGDIKCTADSKISLES